MKEKDKLNLINDTAFNMIDVNNNGQIERNELEEILSLTAEEMGIEKPTKDEVKEIMKWLDPSNKGYLSKYPLPHSGKTSTPSSCRCSNCSKTTNSSDHSNPSFSNIAVLLKVEVPHRGVVLLPLLLALVLVKPPQERVVDLFGL